jgi:hypothetical protein
MPLGIGNNFPAAVDCTFTARSPMDRRLLNKKPVLPPLWVPGNIHELSRNDPPSPPANPPPSPRRRLSMEHSPSYASFGDGRFSQELLENKNELVILTPLIGFLG